MGLFGGGNSSNSTQNTTNNYDQRQVLTDDHSNSGNTYIQTDQGALSAANAISHDSLKIAQGAIDATQNVSAGLFDQSKAVLDFTRDQYRQSLGFADTENTITHDLIKNVLQQSGAQNQAVAQAYQQSQDSQSGNRTLIMMAVGVIGLVAVAFMFKGGHV